MSIPPSRGAAPLSAVLIVLVSACTAAVSPSQQPTERPSAAASAVPSASESSLPTPAPSGFAFSVEAVIGYYESRGFTCDEIQPSATAAGTSTRDARWRRPMGGPWRSDS